MTRSLSEIPTRTLRRWLWGVVGACAAAFLVIVNVILAEAEHPPEFPRPSAALERRRPPPDRSTDLSNLEVIWKTRWGDPPALRKKPEPPPSAPRVEPPSPGPGLETRFEIRGLVSGRRGCCILWDNVMRKEFVVSLDESLPDGLGVLVRVEPDRALFRQGEVEKILESPKREGLAAFFDDKAHDTGCAIRVFLDEGNWREGVDGLIVARPVGDVLIEGDRLLAVNGRGVRTYRDLSAAVGPGAARLTVVRASRTVELLLRIVGKGS